MFLPGTPMTANNESLTQAEDMTSAAEEQGRRAPRPSRPARDAAGEPSGKRLPLGPGWAQRRRLDAAEAVLRLHLESADDARAQTLMADARVEADGLVGRGDGADVVFVASALAALVAEAKVPLLAVAPLSNDLRDRANVKLSEVGLRLLADPRLLMLPLEDLLDVTLALLAQLGPLHGPSVWVAGEPETPRLLRWHGEIPAMVVPGLVSEVLDGSRPVHEGTWTALPVTSFQQPCAVLAFGHDVRDRGPATTMATTLGRLLSRAFERASLFNSAAEHAAVLVRSSERRMTRIGFDLHDGPLQDVALMVGEIKAVADALAKAGGSARFGGELVGRIEDLAGLADYLNENLREVANSLDATSEMRRPFGAALNGILRAFTVRTGVEPELEITGDIDGCSESQRIALLRVAQECLTNIREHSGADQVRLTITAGPTKVEATIEDNGRGFEVDAALRDSARRGRMGLIGIMERIRLLGGFCDIQSTPGAGCRIALSVQRWTPEMAAQATAAKTAAG